MFPNAIILALDADTQFKQARGTKPEGDESVADAGTLLIPYGKDGSKKAWVVDGQQRILALSKTTNSNIPVPVVGFISPDLDVQRQQFIIVNKAKPLPAWPPAPTRTSRPAATVASSQPSSATLSLSNSSN